jgi:hypothetical protein
MNKEIRWVMLNFLISALALMTAALGAIAPAEPSKFFLLENKYVTSEESAIPAGTHLCVAINGKLVDAVVKGMAVYKLDTGDEISCPRVKYRPVPGQDIEADLAKLPFQPARLGKCSSQAFVAGSTEGRSVLLPQDLAKKLEQKARNDFKGALSSAQQAQSKAFRAWDEEFKQGRKNPRLEWTVRIFKLGRGQIADVWIDFFDKICIMAEIPEALREEVDENRVQIGAVHYIIKIAETIEFVVTDSDPVNWIRSWHFEPGGYFSGFRLLSVTDLDANGCPELMIEFGGHESYGVTLFELKGKELVELTSAGSGF